MALIGNISGSSRDSSHIGITGSVIIAHTNAAVFPGFPGSDVVFFVSGSQSAKSSFGGDLVVSGSLNVLSGATLLGDTTEITGDVLVVSGSLLVSGSTVMNGDLTVTGSIYTTNGAEFGGSGLEVTGSLLVSGSTHLNGNLEVTGSVTSTTGFSGSLTKLSDGTSAFIGGTGIFITSASNGPVTTSINNSVVATISGSTFDGAVKFNSGLSGSLTKLSDGSSYLIAGNDISITSGSNGSVTISNTMASASEYFFSTTAGSIYTTSSVAFRGSESSVDAPSDKGTDVTFYVSGSVNNVDIITTGSAQGVSLFGGSVVVSGSMVLSGSLLMGTNPLFYPDLGYSAGKYSITLGDAVGALADYSQVQGTNSFAVGKFSHVEGDGGYTDGFASHVEGYTGYASGSYSHAEGFLASAYGIASHAEGYSSKTTGDYSHAEGYRTNADGNYSHVEGNASRAAGDYSHAEGTACGATGVSSHAEGWSTYARGDYAHSEGYSGQASGSYSHSEGCNTQALGDYSHAEGYVTFVNKGALCSHAEGYQTNVWGSYAHAEGNSSIASGTYSHAEGNTTIASGSYSHAEGYVTKTIGAGSHAEGYYTITSGTYSHAEGFYTIASGSYQLVVGKANKRGNTTSLFVVGNGTGDADANRSDILRVEQSSVQVTGSVLGSGIISAVGGFSGSHTKLTDGTSYLIAGSNATITTGSNGAVTIGLVPSLTGSFSGSMSWSTQTFTGAGPFTASLAGFVLVAPGADPTVLKLPVSAPDGFQTIVKRRDQVANNYILQISGSNSDTIDDGGGTSISTNYGSMTFVKLGSGWYIT